VIGAVRELFVEEGWSAVSHLRIAERSGLSRATIYKYWPDRSALILDAFIPERIALT
jgi:AcrR family transcriptional regulator